MRLAQSKLSSFSLGSGFVLRMFRSWHLNCIYYQINGAKGFCVYGIITQYYFKFSGPRSCAWARYLARLLSCIWFMPLRHPVMSSQKLREEARALSEISFARSESALISSNVWSFRSGDAFQRRSPQPRCELYPVPVM